MIFTGLFRCAGPINNVIVIRRPQSINPQTSEQASHAKRRVLALPPPLEKFSNSPDENACVKAHVGNQTTSDELLGSSYITVQTMEAQIKELQVCIFIKRVS